MTSKGLKCTFTFLARWAILAITALGNKTRLKTGRLDIKLDGETLTVYRMRPHKQMFTMSKNPQGWEPIGFPDLDNKDMELLAKISGMSKDFKVIPPVTPPKIEEIAVVTASAAVAVTVSPKVTKTPVTKKRRSRELGN